MSNEKVRVITEEQYQEYLELKNHISQQEKKVSRWKPERGGLYWVPDTNCECFSSCWTDDALDLRRYKLGFVFETEEEAQKEIARRLAEQEFLDICDWDGGENVYLIEYDDQRDVFDWNWYDYIYSPYRFASKESCQKAIDILGHKKLKLIFRLEED